MGSKCALVVLAAGFALAASASAATPRSGLHGIVMHGPTMPVCRVGVACDAPAAGVTLMFSRAGVVRETRTDQRGIYRIALPPGVYAVTTSSTPFGRTPRPARIHVRAGHSDRIVFTIDTGIR